MRYPPTRSFSGSASALNLMRYLPAILGAHVDLVPRLVGVAELEDDFGIAHREAAT